MKSKRILATGKEDCGGREEKRREKRRGEERRGEEKMRRDDWKGEGKRGRKEGMGEVKNWHIT